MKKLLQLFSLILILSIFLIACSNKEILPIKLDLEKYMKDTLLAKGENYDFLKDDIYIEYMENLMKEFTTKNNYALGNLDRDNTPELVIFNEKDPNDLNDEGSLEVYSFNGKEYVLLDTVSMGFDNSNYEMKIGKISENQRGLFLNNNIGTSSGLTYGFILENGKFKSILNDNKVSLISVSTENKIKDINNDGILNFSIITIDPETEEISVDGSDKMTLWYKWDGKDSATLIDLERKDYSKKNSNEEILRKAKSLVANDFPYALDFIIANKDKLSKYDNSILVKSYIEKLDKVSFEKGIEINNLFFKDGKDINSSHLSVNFLVDIENLNSKEYLRREKTLKDHEDIKNNLLENINLGFKLNMSEGIYYYLVDYQKFINLFAEDILNEYGDYLKIQAFNSNKPFMDDGSLVISQDQLIERILYAESFKMLYPYSKLLPEVNELYNNYINIYFFGDLHNPSFDCQTKMMKDESLERFKEVAKKYEFTRFNYIVNDFLLWLQENNNLVDDNIKEKLFNRLN